MEDYEEEIAADKNNLDAYSKWREAIKNLKEPDQALEEYRDTIQINLDTAEAYKDCGNLFLYFEQYENAIIEYIKALNKDANYAKAYNNWGVALNSLKRHDEAIEKYIKAIEKDENYKEAYYNYGNALDILGIYEEAIEKYKKAIDIDPNDKNVINVYNNWGCTLLNLSKYAEAIEKYKKAIDIDPNDKNVINVYNNWGCTLLNLSKYDEAIEKYKKAIEENDKYINAYYNWGEALIHLEKYEEAIEKYEKAIEIDPKDENVIGAYSNLGNALDKLGRYEEAIENFKMAIEEDPKYENLKDVYNNWGCTLLNLESYEEAIEKYRKAIELDENYINAHYNWGLALNGLRRYEKAINKFEYIINYIKAKNVNTLMGLAYALEKTGRYEDAFNQYNEAHKCNENEPYPIHAIAALKDKQGLYKDAYIKWNEVSKVYEKYIEDKKSKNISDHYLNFGSIYQYTTLNKLNEVEKIYNEGLKNNPGNIHILINLISLSLKKNNNDYILSLEKENEKCNKTQGYYKAFNYFNQAENILKERLDKRQSFSNYFNLGKLYMAMNKTQKAEESFTKALSIDNENIDCLIYLGSFYMQNKNYEKAIQSFEEVTKQDPDNLDLRSNLAEAYLMKGLTERAESEYREILDITDFHMDSLIGIAQTYITMGENALERKDLENAYVFFKNAEHYQKRVVKLMQDDYVHDASEILAKNEKSEFYYLKGYTEVKLYEIEKPKDYQLLRIAKADFLKVKKGTQDYYKAQRAITKIDERLKTIPGFVDKWGAVIIVISSLIVFILTQLNFFVAQPIFSFFTTKKLEPEYYALLTFSCLLFMIAGMYISQITKLKVGALELEKNTIDQNPTSSLNVDKNSFNKAPLCHNHMISEYTTTKLSNWIRI